MKIAVTAKGAGLGAWLDLAFETCLQIVIVDDNNRFEAWMNPYRESFEQTPLALAKKLAEEHVDVLVTASISTPSLNFLKEAGIKVLLAEHASILELVEAVRNNTLKEAG